MAISSNLNNLRSMIHNLGLARENLRLKKISPDEYFTLICGSVNRLRLEEVMGSDLTSEEHDEIAQEANVLSCHLAVVQRHRNSTCFQGGDFDLYLDLQNPGGNFPSLSGWGVL